VITANPFAYTANLGLNALTGVVVEGSGHSRRPRASAGGGVDVETEAPLRAPAAAPSYTRWPQRSALTPMILSRFLWSPMAA
jgi:hypothetical protein